jgi:hypothetical protein
VIEFFSPRSRSPIALLDMMNALGAAGQFRPQAGGGGAPAGGSKLSKHLQNAVEGFFRQHLADGISAPTLRWPGCWVTNRLRN